MTREIKFRAWNTDYKDTIMESFTLMEAMYSGDAFRLHDKNIMEFIGLHDKNGKEIYEGDLIYGEDEQIVEVEWDKEKAAFVVNYCDGDKLFMDDFNDLFVVGNIYENPELLEE